MPTNDTPPVAPEAAAPRPRRRGRIIAGVAAGIVGVGLAVGAGVALLKPQQSATPAAPPLPERTAAEVCAEARQLVTDTFTTGADGAASLEAGAARAWLCGDDAVSEGMASGTAGPVDPLTDDVDQAIDWYLKAEPADPMQPCTMEYRLSYTVAFEYPDGSLAPVRGELHGCRSVTDGTSTKQGGQEFYDLLLGLWDENRGADFAAEREHCTASATMVAADPADAVTGALCQVSGGEAVVGELDPADAAAIGAAVAAQATEAPDMLTYPDEPTRLELLNAAGDMFSLELLADGSFVYYDASGAKLWTPTTQLGSVLQAASATKLPIPGK